jgi:hypothetical protein
MEAATDAVELELVREAPAATPAAPSPPPSARRRLDRLLDSPLVGGPDEPVQRNGVPLRGVTRALASAFGGGHGPKTRRQAKSSLELGAEVHREVRRFVDGPGRPIAMHPWSALVLWALEERGLRPLACEVAVGAGPLATRIDVAAERALTGAFVLVSLKTGARRGPERSGARRARRLPGSFSDLPRCERTLDMLQIAAERGLARIGHGVEFDEALVLEVPELAARAAPAWTADPEKQRELLDILAAAARKP